MNNAVWVNDHSHLYGLDVAVLGPRVSFYDVKHGEVVRAFVNHENPEATRFEIGGGGTASSCLTVTKGKGLTERLVKHYTNRDTTKRLRVGITVHRSAFSSLPHEFEKNPVPGFEEAFYIITQGKGLVEGDGLLGASPVDTAWPVGNANLVAVPMGWHRVVALPNDDDSLPPMAYVWAYLAKQPNWEKD